MVETRPPPAEGKSEEKQLLMPTFVKILSLFESPHTKGKNCFPKRAKWVS